MSNNIIEWMKKNNFTKLLFLILKYSIMSQEGHWGNKNE